MSSPFFVGLALVAFTLFLVATQLGERPAMQALVGLALPMVMLAHRETPKRTVWLLLASLTAVLLVYVLVIVNRG